MGYARCGMKRLPLARRLEYWKYECAALTFENAVEIATYLIGHTRTPLMYPLLTSLYVLYGRSFKQKKNIRIPEALVPLEYLAEHRFLIGLRDKLFAHVDVEGLADQKVDHLTKILLRIQEGKASVGMASRFPIGFRFERIKALCENLYQACSEKAKEILVDAMGSSWPPEDLTYEVDLRPGDSYLLKQAEWNKRSIVWGEPRGHTYAFHVLGGKPGKNPGKDRGGASF
jgi:hypothetical protein